MRNHHNGQEARPVALGDNDEPQGDLPGEGNPPTNATPNHAIQERNCTRRRKGRGGLSKAEQRYCCTRLMAEDLAERLIAFWRERGVNIHAWIEPLGGTHAEFVVRSSLNLSSSPEVPGATILKSIRQQMCFR